MGGADRYSQVLGTWVGVGVWTQHNHHTCVAHLTLSACVA